MTDFKVGDKVQSKVEYLNGIVLFTYSKKRESWSLVKWDDGDIFPIANHNIKYITKNKLDIGDIVDYDGGTYEVTAVNLENETYDIVSLDPITVSFKKLHGKK